VDTNWQILQVGTADVKDWIEWAITCPRGSKIAIDSRMISHERATRLYKGLYERGSKLAHPRQNLIDLVWEQRPKRPKDLVYVQPTEFTGREAKEKLSDVRKWIRKQNAALGKPSVSRSASTASNAKRESPLRRQTTNASKTLTPTPTPPPPSAFPGRVNTPAGVKRSNSVPTSTPDVNAADRIAALFVSDLASIAYILNLRGSDIPYNPVFTAYLFIGEDGKTVLFIENDKVPKEVRDYLHENGVSIREYSDVWTYLRAKQWGEGKLILNPTTPYAVSLIVGSARYIVLPAIIEEMKAVKNTVELDGMRNAYLRDGIAMVRWFAWLEHKFSQGYDISEWEASEKLNDFRRQGGGEDGVNMYMGLAYENIVATGGNAALPHYTPSKNECALISKNEPFLVDSGGQYRDGTCDTTRTVHFGYPTIEQGEAFTRVLQGHVSFIVLTQF
jgi:Xaa-Pro aminopeptidase